MCLCFRANDRLNIGAVWFGSRGLKPHTEAHIYNSMLLSKNILAAHLECSRVKNLRSKKLGPQSMLRHHKLAYCCITRRVTMMSFFVLHDRGNYEICFWRELFFGKSTSLSLNFRKFKKSRRYLFKESLYYLFISFSKNSLMDSPVDNCAVIERLKGQTYVVY